VANLDSTLAAALAAIEGTPLGLQEATELAAANATDARQAEAELAAALGALRTEKGVFDPELFGELGIREEDTPTASPFTGADVLQTEQRSALGGARVRLLTGAEVAATIAAIRLETNSAFAALVPEYDTAARLTVVQPLLAGAGPAARGERTAAQRQFDAARVRYEDALLLVRADVEQVYWDLHAAERDLAVQQLIRERAQALLTEAEQRARAGLVGPNDVAVAQVFLAEQEQALLDRQEELDAISDQLASLLGRRPQPGFTRFRPVDDPPREFPQAPSDSLVAWAQQHNLELQARGQEVAAAQALARAAGWDALPDLAVFGSVGGSGLAGDPRSVTFGDQTFTSSVSGDMGDALDQAISRDFPNWSAGVTLTSPLSTRARGGERDRLRAEVLRAQQQELAAARSLEEEVRAAYRELSNGEERLRAALQGVDASAEQVRIGLIEFRSGRTTAFELVRLGADLATAQQRYSQALVRSAKAAARLRQLTGNAYPTEAMP
jgi:outer membrane protein TolC